MEENKDSAVFDIAKISQMHRKKLQTKIRQVFHVRILWEEYELVEAGEHSLKHINPKRKAKSALAHRNNQVASSLLINLYA